MKAQEKKNGELSIEKRAQLASQLDQDSINKIEQIVQEKNHDIEELRESMKKLENDEEGCEEIIKDMLMKQEEEINNFHIKYQQAMIETAYTHVQTQENYINKAKRYEQMHDEANAKKYYQLAIEKGEEETQTLLNLKDEELRNEYDKLLQKHKKTYSNLVSNSKSKMQKQMKILNKQLEDLISERDCALLEVRTDYICKWGKIYPDDEKHIAYRRFMEFFEEILQNYNIPVPKATVLYGNKFSSLLSTNTKTKSKNTRPKNKRML